MTDLDIFALAADLRARKLSSVELAQECLRRAERLNTRLNAFITLDPAKTLAEATEADRRRAAGEDHPLLGIPLAHKDLFCTRGWLTTCGSRMLSNFVAPYDAHVIERFKAVGAVNLGKTNMDEFAMGSSNENSHFGPARNPWDLAAVPGGSSGGSACAVAARMAPGALGTDTGGSIRLPAALCGITGIKPTYGVVSRYGMVAYASSLDQGGPMARSAREAALLLSTMAGFDKRDSTSLDRPTEDYGRDLERPLKGLKLGLPTEYFGSGLSTDVGSAVEQALTHLRRAGCETVTVSLPNTGLCVPAYYVLAPAEASSNLARYDGVRYGYRAAQYGDLKDMYQRSRAEGFGEEVKRRILIGTYVLSHGYYDAYYLKAQKVRRLIANDFARAFEQCDLIVGPTSPTVAFDLGARNADPVQMYLSDIYTTSANLAGLPGMSVPCGFGEKARPVGLQIMGNYFAEARMLNLAHQYQGLTDWHRRRPDGLE
ncbi:MAG: Asp-tRNA(Asn)/Glu-tRNA(Gln) amidotransferase subunit GatA [Betaproteobacteria bacterium]|nr:Asp-tRNA(Asn)/Glu-tRNA(Gln) amidotransferase subunit GatA [Betaproteobacteria bacterium]